MLPPPPKMNKLVESTNVYNIIFLITFTTGAFVELFNKVYHAVNQRPHEKSSRFLLKNLLLPHMNLL